MIDTYKPVRENLKANWMEMVEPGNVITDWDTGVPINVLKYVGASSVAIPDDFVRLSAKIKYS